jgi:hypothetical protein
MPVGMMLSWHRHMMNSERRRQLSANPIGISSPGFPLKSSRKALCAKGNSSPGNLEWFWFERSSNPFPTPGPNSTGFVLFVCFVVFFKKRRK